MKSAPFIMLFLLGVEDVGKIGGLRCYECMESSAYRGKSQACSSENSLSRKCTLQRNSTSGRGTTESGTNQTTTEDIYEDDLGDMTDSIEDTPDLEFKNPVCFRRTSRGLERELAGCMEREKCEQFNKRTDMRVTCCDSHLCNLKEDDNIMFDSDGKPKENPIGYLIMTCPLFSVLLNALFY